MDLKIKTFDYFFHRFDPEARLLNTDASKIMKKCNFFPSEFSLVFTFYKESIRNQNEYLLTLLAPVIIFL